MGEARRLVKNTGIIAVGGMATKLVQFLLLPLYTSVLSTAEYGTVDYLNTVALFCVPVVSLLMDEALFRFLIDCEDDKDRRRVVTATCCLLVLGSIAFLGIAGLYVLLSGTWDLGWVVALVFASVLLQMVSALLRGMGDTVSYAVANFLASAVMIVLNVVFIAVFRWGVTGMLLATILAQGGTSVLFAVIGRVWQYVDLGSLSLTYLGRLLRYSIPLIPNKVSWTIMNMSSRLVIMNVLGASPAGLFAIAYKFPNVMDQIYGFFYMSWKESSARALNSSEDEVGFYNRIYRLLRRFMMSVVLGMVALMPLVFDILIDPSYHEGVLYVPILLLATYYSNISGFYGGIFTAHKDTKIMGTTTIVAAVICLVLNVLLIPTVGLYGASAATLVALLLVNEYRRRKVSSYAALEENACEFVFTVVCLITVFGGFYLYVYLDALWALALSIIVALVFFLVANKEMVESAFLLVRRRGKGTRG